MNGSISVGPSNKSASSGLIGNTIPCAPRNFSRRQVHLVYERAEIDIVHHALEEIVVLAAGRRFSGKKEIVQPDRRGAECVGLNDIGAGFEVLRVDFLNDLRLRQKKKLEAAFEILALPIAKPLSAIVVLRKFVALDHRTHGAVENDDALGQKCFQGMKISRH